MEVTMRLTGLLIVTGVALLVAAGFTISLTVGLAMSGLGCIWIARQAA
jgi:hypothetical protein